MESKPVKTSLWERAKSFMVKTVETVKRHAGNPTHKYLQKSSSTYAGLVKEAGKRKAKKSLCYNAELPSLPYKEDFPLFEPGTRLTHTKHLTSFSRVKLIQHLWPDYAQDLLILLSTVNPTFSSSSWTSKLLGAISACQLWSVKLLAKLTPTYQKKTAKEVSPIVTEIIKNEIKHPGYQSFFHGAAQRHALIFELHKKLYQLYGDKKASKHFEFLRAPENREHLRETTREKYIEDNPEIQDDADPYRTDLLSITYRPWHQSLGLYESNTSYNYLNTEKLIETALSAYDLPLPKYLQSDLSIDSLSETHAGILLQILIQNQLANKLSYEAQGFLPPFGMPVLTQENLLATPEETRKILRFKAQTEGRIILDPTHFDHPNPMVKIFLFQSKEMLKQNSKLCDKIIADAQKRREDDKYLLLYLLNFLK